MKHLIVAGLAGLALFAVSCQQKPKEEAEQPSTPTQEQQAKQESTAEEQTAQQAQEQQAKQEEKPQVVAQAPTAVNAEALAKSKGCFACHDINVKKVGPAFKDVAKKEAGKVDEVAHKIKNGGVGEWGNVPMPPQNVTEEEAKQLAQWILSLK